MVLDPKPVDDGKISAGIALDGLNRFPGKGKPFFPRPAIAVIATVPEAGHELVKQIALMAVKFNAVSSRLTAAHRGIAECARQCRCFFSGERPAVQISIIRHIKIGIFRGRNRLNSVGHDEGRDDTAKPGGKLHAQPAVMGMKPLRQLAHRRDMLIVGHGEKSF